MPTLKKTKENRSNRLPKEKAGEYLKEYNEWKSELEQYWPQIDKNQEMYEGYLRADNAKTDSQFSFNTAITIVEGMVNKANESSLEIAVDAEGENGLTFLEKWVSAVVKKAMDDKDVAKFYGSFRKVKEKYEREFFVKGNAIAEVGYCYKTEVIGDKKITVGNNPYVKVINYKNYIFNPAHDFDTSPIKYIQKHVKFDDLKKDEYDEKTSKGKYKNLGEVKALAKKADKLLDHEDLQNISGQRKINKKIEPLRLIERHEGARLITIAAISEKSGVIIRDEIDQFKLGGDNLVTSMNYVVEGRPYARGEIDAIYKIVLAQDDMVNLKHKMLERYLQPSVVVDPSGETDLDELIQILEEGGVMYGQADKVKAINPQLPPNQAFQADQEYQQAIERAARYSPYAAGVPNQETDKTAGTMGGIQSLQQASEPNFQVKIDTLKETFLEPVATAYLKMIGGLMGDDEVRYGLLQGASRRWIKATKGILTGEATIDEMIEVGLMTEDQAIEFTTTEEPILNENGDQMIDTNTMTPMTQVVEIPGAREALVFDVDWAISITMGMSGVANQQQKSLRQMQLVQQGLQMGVPIDVNKAWLRTATEQGLEDPEELLMEQDQLDPMMAQQGQQAALEQQTMSPEMMSQQADNEPVY